MYGDTAVIGQRAATLRALATDTRDQAAILRGAVGTSWVSAAAASYTEALADRARNLDTAATSLEEAADALDAHARAVDAVKRAIVEAEHWVSERWDDARRLAGNAVEVVRDGVATVFEFFGREVPRHLVTQAEDLLHSVPALPIPGSPDWLDLAHDFTRRGL